MSVTNWEETNITNVFNCSINYCTNGCGHCIQDYFCYDEASDAVSTPPAGVCNRFFYAEIEHFMPVENFVSAAVDYTNFQLAEAPKMAAYNNLNMIYELRFVQGDKTWMSPVNTYNMHSIHSPATCSQC
ncbi:D-arabinono-1,4-lactone oxidase, partial [Scytalidium lignicola]